MSAGLNLVGRVWSFSYPVDDSVGGALPSGTILHDKIDLRIEANKPTQALLEQGIEDISTFSGFLSPHTLLIKNNNEIEITAPANSVHYGKFYRVMGDPQVMSLHASDSRGYLFVSLKRVEKSRSIQ